MYKSESNWNDSLGRDFRSLHWLTFLIPLVSPFFWLKVKWYNSNESSLCLIALACAKKFAPDMVFPFAMIQICGIGDAKERTVFCWMLDCG